jgi:nitronate monooxygenase
MDTIPKLKIKGFELPYCIIQGGMGAGVSRPRLTREVFRCGGLGVLSSAGLKDIYSLEKNNKYNTYQAVREEIETAMANNYLVGINVMRVLDESYDETIRAAIDAQVSAIFFGAGVPKRIEHSGETAQILIASSARTLKIILRYWKHCPDAVILEGPKAGGHLGFHFEDIDDPASALENLLPEVLEVAAKNGNFPVIVAGGIFTKADILKFLKLGASGVQMATRFLATHESSATNEFKRHIVSSTEKDILVVNSSPCGFPFRILTSSPMYQEKRQPKCDMGYVLGKDSTGKFTVCRAHPNNPLNKNYFCICNGLRAAIGLTPNEPPLYTVGSNAYRVKSIISVSELMRELVEG